MNLSSITIPKLNLPWRGKQSGPRRSGGPVAVVHWDREKIHYLVVSPKSRKIKANDIGSVAHADVANPFLALANHFKQTGLQVKQLVLLLSRPELDQLNLSLPPSELSELPMLVASEVEQQLGENDEAATVDFCLLPTSSSADENSSNTTQQVMAFALSAKVERSLLAQLDEAGLKAVAIGSRHLSPLGILRRRHVPANTLTVSIHLYAGEAELAFCLGAAPLLLRSIRIIAEEPARIAEQIWLESQRCLALLPNEVADLPFSWFVFTSCEVAWPVAQALEDHDQIVVQPVDPLIGWEVDTPEADSPAKLTSAANSGAAWDFLEDEMPINLLEPKRAPKPSNPIYRWSAIAAAGVAAIGVGVYFMLADVNRLQDEVTRLENDLSSAKKVAAKYQEKADQVNVVESWLADQVDWVAELNNLSQRLPDGQNATVRRLTASANAKSATIDLAVQVAKQETISQFEGSIRGAKYSVSSKQISQNPESIEYPWQFETRIVFPITPANPKEFKAPSVETTTAPPSPSPAETQP